MENDIITLRQELGLTQQQLAERLGVNIMTVWRWENGLVKPSGPARIALQSLRPNYPAQVAS